MHFLQPQFLPLLSLGLIPLFIHLLTRLRLRRQNFPSLHLLQTVHQERFSWVRLKEILLLLLRTLVLLIIPLGLSRPGFEPGLPVRFGAERVLVILDDSYSMGYGSRWQKAVSSARLIIQNSSQPELLLASRADTLFTGRNFINRLLDTISPSAGAWTLFPALLRADSLSRQRGLPVVLITDLQERALSRIDFSFPPGKLQIVNLGTQQFDNAGVTGISLHNNRIKVELFNYGGAPVTRTVTLKLKNSVQEQTIALPPRTPITIEFLMNFEKPGLYPGSVELSADSLLIDNVRYFVFHIPEKITVPLFVPTDSAGKYLYWALLTDTLHFQPLTLKTSALSSTQLSHYPVIIIADPGNLKPADFDRLNFYLNSGGSALLCVPNLPSSGLERLIPHQGKVISTGFVTPAEIDTTHPLLADFRTDDFKPIRIFQHTRLAGGRTLIRLTDQSPLVIELPEKNLLVWAFTPEPAVTDLIYKAVFVPLLHQSLKYLVLRTIRHDWFVGDTVVLSVRELAPLRLIGPAGEKTVLPEPALARPLVKITTTRVPGNYRLENNTVYAFSVNPLPAEGDLTPIAEAQLSSLGGKIISSDLHPAGELTALLLYLAAALLAVELVVIGLENYRKTPVRK